MIRPGRHRPRRLVPLTGVAVIVAAALSALLSEVHSSDTPAAKPGGPKRPDRQMRVYSIHVSPHALEAYEAAIGKPAATVIHPPNRPVPGPVPIRPGAEVRPMVPPRPSGARISGGTEAMPLLDSFVGMVDNGSFIPPDTHGAAGPAHLVSMINRGYAVFDRSGAIVQGPTSHQAFWAALGTLPGQPAEFPFDPVVLYDQYAERFIATAVSGNFATASWLLFAISDSSNPTLGWTLYGIDTTVLSPTGFADFPGLGLDPDRYTLSINIFSFVGGFFEGADFFIIDKSTVLSGGAATISAFNDGFQGFVSGTWRPTHAFGPTSVSYLTNSGWSVPGTTTHFIGFQEISGPANAPVITDLGWVQTADCCADGIQDAPQSGCSEAINTGQTRLLNAVQRNGKVWSAQAVDDTVADGIGKAQIAWYEIDPTVASGPGPYLPPVNQGIISDPSLWFYYPSIAVNADECVAIGFAGSGSGNFAGGYYTSRQAGDPAGFVEPVGLLKDGEDPYFKRFSDTRNRWGDYSATMVDPLNDRGFWTIQEYALPESGGGCPVGNTGNWGTFWGKFACTTVPPCEESADCDDGLVCNGAETCDVSTGQCLAGTVLDCDDMNDCTLDSCDEGVGGCVHDFSGADNQPCQDGDLCTVGQICAAGTCSGGGPLDCDDLDVCTMDSCDSGIGCVNAPETDTDNDTVCDLIDCAPLDPNFQTDPEAVAATVAVTHALGTGIATLTWNAIPQAAHYNTYSSTLADSSTMTCLESDDSDANGAQVAEDTTVPAAGSIVHYLITGESPCGEGSVGEECSTPGPICTPGPPRADPIFCPTPP